MGAQWKHAGRTANSAARGQLFGKLAKEIIVAAKMGGPDPTGNSRLRMAIDSAKKQSMPRDTIERAIKKGAGLLDEVVNYETVTYEGFAPHQVPVVVECLTENKTRTAANIRMAFRKGQIAASGAITWDFLRQGVIEATPPAGGADAEAAAIEAGAQNVEKAEGNDSRFFTETTDLDAVTKALTAAGWQVHESKLAWLAKNPVELTGAARTEVEEFLAELDADDDVQEIFVGLK